MFLIYLIPMQYILFTSFVSLNHQSVCINIRVSAPPLSITLYHCMCYSYFYYVSNVPYLYLFCHCINILNVLYQYRSLCTWWSTSFYHFISPCITGCTVSRSSKRKPGLGCCGGWRRAMWTVFFFNFFKFCPQLFNHLLILIFSSTILFQWSKVDVQSYYCNFHKQFAIFTNHM